MANYKGKLNIPNLITYSGAISVLVYMGLALSGIMNLWTALLLLWGYLADCLDGNVARWTNKTTFIGSISDFYTDKCREFIMVFLIIMYYPTLMWPVFIFFVWDVIKAVVFIPWVLGDEKKGAYKSVPLIRWTMEVIFHIRTLWLIMVLAGLYFPYSEFIFLALLLIEIPGHIWKWFI